MRIKDAHDLVDSSLHDSARKGVPHDACYFRQAKAKRAYSRAQEDLLVRFEDWLTENFPDGIEVPEDTRLLAVSEQVQVSRRGRYHIFGKRMALRGKGKDGRGQAAEWGTGQVGFTFLYNPTERAWFATGGEHGLGTGNNHIDTLVLLEELIA